MSSDTFPDFLNLPVDEVARRLLGCELEAVVDDQPVRLRIVETEAYDETDEASHAYGGERKRNATMFKASGYLYVYFTYGMHYCCNVVTGEKGVGSGVLLRAAEPLVGKEILEARRQVVGVNATNGPAKLCKALGVDLTMNGHNLHDEPLKLYQRDLQPGEAIVTSPRVGISKAVDVHRRFYIAGNPYVSKK